MKQRNKKQAGDGDELSEVRRVNQNQGDAAANQSNSSISFIIKIIQFVLPLHLCYFKFLSTHHAHKVKEPSAVDVCLKSR
jgi:hypothetical protein